MSIHHQEVWQSTEGAECLDKLPLVIETDNVHMRYCASFLIGGKPDRTLHGEYWIHNNGGDPKQQRQFAVDDARRKLMQNFKNITDKNALAQSIKRYVLGNE